MVRPGMTRTRMEDEDLLEICGWWQQWWRW
jgi:hypothetical protein